MTQKWIISFELIKEIIHFLTIWQKKTTTTNKIKPDLFIYLFLIAGKLQMTALSITSLMLMEAIWLITALYGAEGTTAFLGDPNTNPNTP